MDFKEVYTTDIKETAKKLITTEAYAVCELLQEIIAQLQEQNKR